jgi:hypothetical protein
MKMRHDLEVEWCLWQLWQPTWQPRGEVVTVGALLLFHVVI